MNVFFSPLPHHNWKTYFKIAGYFIDNNNIAPYSNPVEWGGGSFVGESSLVTCTVVCVYQEWFLFLLP